MELIASVCYVIVGFCIMMYVLLDGFDLGIGMMFPFFTHHERDVMVSTILPVWDGNQTWLVLGVATFYGAFPMAFSMVLPVLYLPLFVMVISLLFRGVTFEFRLKEKTHRWVWNLIFCVSSFIITLCQGILLGSFVSGFDFTHAPVVSINIITPFHLFCGVALIFGYTLLGSTWIIAKTDGELKNKMYPLAKWSLMIVSACLVAISLWSPFINSHIWVKWFGANFHIVVFLPLFTAGVIAYLYYAIRKQYEYRLYFLSVLIFVCSFIGFAISTWPYIVPHQVTMWEAASPPSSQLFLLVGALILLPILIAYTSYAYYIFRGKVSDVIDYD